MATAYVTFVTFPSLSITVPVALALLGALCVGPSPSRSPGLGNSGNAPPFGVFSSPDRAGWRVPTFVGDVDLSVLGLIFGRTSVDVLAGRPSLVACFCWATVIGDLISRCRGSVVSHNRGTYDMP